ncbi:MAG: hypothetical protein KAI40_07060 [Desulfobacterales bacterium]|nr:hypothetical protein [Desulfobacterales bacterium]
MAEKTKMSKEEKKQEKDEKKALKKKAKIAAKIEKKNKKEPKNKSNDKPEDKSDLPKKKSFFSIKKLIIFSVIFILIMGSGFVVYKIYFSSSNDPIVYKSITLKSVDLPDEMLKFSFDHVNDLYFSFITYDLRIHLLNIEIDRINKIGENYPDQNKIAEKERNDWVKAKEKVEKKFIKIEKEIRELYVLYNVNKEEGIKKVEEKDKELLLQANEALETLDPYIKIIETTKEKEPQGLINNILHKIKKIIL